MHLLAYGEFDAYTPEGVFFEVLPFFLGWVAPALFVYIVASIIAERCPFRWLGVLVFVFWHVFFTPKGVMGAWGPAHVGMETGFWAWPLCLVALLGKTIILEAKAVRRRQRARQAAALQAGPGNNAEEPEIPG